MTYNQSHNKEMLSETSKSCFRFKNLKFVKYLKKNVETPVLPESFDGAPVGKDMLGSCEGVLEGEIEGV